MTQKKKTNGKPAKKEKFDRKTLNALRKNAEDHTEVVMRLDDLQEDLTQATVDMRGLLTSCKRTKIFLKDAQGLQNKLSAAMKAFNTLYKKASAAEDKVVKAVSKMSANDPTQQQSIFSF